MIVYDPRLCFSSSSFSLISHTFTEEKRQITDFEYPSYDGKVGKAGVDFPVGNFMSLVQQEDESIIVFGGNI
jgi:hypothetical protein